LIRSSAVSPTRFTAAERRAIETAIADAERGHRGEIRVHVERRYPGDGPLQRAAALFSELGMERTQGGTGVLLYIAELDRKAAVFAGPGVYGAREPGFWRQVTDAVAEGHRSGDRIGGLRRALELVGAILREAAPGEDLAGDELPDRVTTA
jgi:uncharacterized membrane protein